MAPLAATLGGRQLEATYTADGAELSGPGYVLKVGSVSVGRGGSVHLLAPKLAQRASAATYRTGSMSETFRPMSLGIEQTFVIGKAPPGAGALRISVPVTGLVASDNLSCGRSPVRQSRAARTALEPLRRAILAMPRPHVRSARCSHTSGSIDLRDRLGRVRATYTDLRVEDATGRAIPATMHPSPTGGAVVIEVYDARASYPITIDPTWSEIGELTASGGAAGDYAGLSVSISGTTAAVGAPDKTLGSYTDSGAVYIYTENKGIWSQQATLDDPYYILQGLFGTSVALSGSTLFVGAPTEYTSSSSHPGAVYVYTESGGSWTQQSEITASDALSFGDFGQSLAVSGTTLVVGAAGSQTYSGGGVVYVFSESGTSWTQQTELHVSQGSNICTSGPYFFGSSLAISGSTLLVGSPQQEVSGNICQGAAYIYTGSGSSWTDQAELTASDYSVGDMFGLSVAIEGTTALVGAPAHTVGSNSQQGAAYVFGGSGSSWTQQAELTSSDGAAGDLFGWSVAVSGTNAVFGAPFHEVGTHLYQGAAYVFSGAGSHWLQQAELTASDGAASDQLGSSVATSGLLAIAGAPDHAVGGNSDEGAAYVFNGGALVQPQGSPVGPDAWVDGSPSTPCQCARRTSSRPPAGDQVDPATGDVHDISTDLSLPGAGIPVSFTRSYDAQAAQAEVAASAPVPALGYGWSYNLGMSLSYNSSTTTATITEENGAEVSFTQYSSGTSPAWCTSATNFCSSAPRIDSTLNHNSDGTWTYVRYAGGRQTDTFSFSSSGALSSISDVQGDTLSQAAYSAGSGQTACPSGDSCIAWTSSASGRELVLGFDSSGQLTTVFDANSTLAATFSYTGTGCTSWGSSQSPDLCSATDPGGITSSFTYDAGNSNSDLDYDMLTETAPGASAQTTNVFDSAGRVTQQTNPSGHVTTFSYSGTNSSLAGGATTVTTYPLGTGSGEPENSTQYVYSSNILVGETIGFGTASASSRVFERDPASLLPLEVEDGDGNISSSNYETYSTAGGTPVSSADSISSTDGVGTTTATAYNSYNQPWCTVDAADYLNGAHCPSSPPSSPPAPGASDPNLGATISFYNSSDELTAVTDALGNTSVYFYTSGITGVPNGLDYCSLDPADYQADYHAGTTCSSYNTHYSGATTETYDSAGDLTATTDPDGNTTSYSYGVSGHPGLVSSESDPDGTTTSFSYNSAGEVTEKDVKSGGIGGYVATTLYAYDAFGRRFCEVDPLEAAQSVTCPSSPPSTPPTPTSDPYLGATITTYDADGRVVQVTNPLGGITYTAYDEAGEVYCSVAPFEAAVAVTCPSLPITTPTPGSDSYLGATITSYDADGRVVQVTNPLGGITLTSYDAAGNVAQTTVESGSSSAPNVVTAYTYDGDNRLASTTVGSGSTTATTAQSYDPNGNLYCSVSANAYAAGSSSYQCPPWQASWITAPPSPSSLYSSSPTASQANNVTTTFYDANGDELQTTNPDVETSVEVYDPDGRVYCSSDAVNVGGWLAANSGGTYPYDCPSTAPTTPPVSGAGYSATIYDPAGRVTSVTKGATFLDGISCPSATSCTAADVSGDALSWNGSAWQTNAVDGSVTVKGVSCPSTSFCAAVDSAGSALVYGSGSWSSPSLIDSGKMLTAVSCASSSFCVATDNAGNVEAYNGTGWTRTFVDSKTLDGVSCPTTSFCVAVDNSGRALTWNGTSWSSPSTIDGTNHLAAVSCVSSSFCVAVDFSGNAVAWNGTSWSVSDIDSTRTIEAVSCASASSCMAVGTSGYAVYWNGTSWSTPTEADETALRAVSCPSTSFCMATDNAGEEVTWNGTTWSTPVAVDEMGGTTSYTYAPGGEVLTVTDPRGSVTTNCYYYENGTGQCAAAAPASGGSDDDLYKVTTPATSADPSGETTSLTYYPGGTQKTVTTPAGTTTDSYDALGDLASVAYSSTGAGYAAATNVTYTYNVDGSRHTMGDGAGTTTYSYDAAGDVTSQAFAAGSTSGLSPATLGYSYYPTGVLKTVVYPSYGSYTNPAATYAYDARGSMTSVTDWAGNTVGFSIDGDGNETAQQNAVSSGNPSGTSSTTFAFDAADYAASATSTLSCSGSSGTFTQSFSGAGGSRNADGQVTKDSESYQSPCSGTSYTRDYSYDPAGQLTYQGSTAQTASVANDFNYDASGDPSLVSSHDGSGGFDTYAQAFDAAGEVTSQTPVSGSSGSSSTYSYDTLGDLASSTTGSVTTAFGYDPTGKTDVALPSAGSPSIYSYSGDGQLASLTGSWSSTHQVDGTNLLDGISCPTTSFCAAVDQSGNAVMYNGTSWTASAVDSNQLKAVSCPTTSFCVAVDGSGYALTYNGSWGSPSLIDSGKALGSVSCPTTSFCVAVDNSGNELTWSGSSWTKTNVDSHTLDRVSCASSTFCVAVDDRGYETTLSGTHWSSPSDIDGSNHIGSVSCPTATFCAAVDNSGYAVVYTSAGWSSARAIDSGKLIESVTCTSAIACLAVDSAGDVITFDATASSAVSNIDGTNALRGPSCPSITWCVAIDNNGSVLTFSSPLVLSGSTSGLSVVMSDSSNYFVYGPAGEPVEQMNVTSSPPSANPVFLTYEASDSSWLVTNASGVEVGFYRYDAYGTLATGTQSSAFGYAGQYAGTGAASGVDNMRARWYAPQTGQFTSRDPAFSQTDQAYTYAADDPVNGSDPSGLRGGSGPAHLLACIDQGPNSTNAACQNYWATMQTYSCSDLAVCADPFYALYLAEQQTISDLFNPCVGVGQVGIDELHVIAGNAAIAGLILGGADAFDSLFGDAGVAGGDAATGGPGTPSVGQPPDSAWPVQSIGQDCTQCAITIQQRIGGQIETIEPAGGEPKLGPSIYDPNGTWSYHTVVVKNGLIFDSFTGPQGVPIDQYLQFFKYADAVRMVPGFPGG
jgi:RHS repeat-associated protein